MINPFFVEEGKRRERKKKEYLTWMIGECEEVFLVVEDSREREYRWGSDENDWLSLGWSKLRVVEDLLWLSCIRAKLVALKPSLQY
jgi:hypothetical protein